jgi:hypothetical protein
MFDKIVKQKRVIELVIIIIGFLFIGLFVLAYFSPNISGPLKGFFILFGVLAFSGVYLFLQKRFKRFSDDFKKDNLTSLVKSEFENGDYYTSYGIYEYEALKSKLLNKEDRFKSEDLVKGTYLEVDFKMSDVLLQDVRETHDSKKVRTIFKGKFFEFSLPESMDNNIVIVSKRHRIKDNPFHKISIETLSDKFDVYSNNEETNTEYLSKHLVESILTLENEYNNTSFSFIDEKLYVAINNGRDSFDIHLFKKFDYNYLEVFKNELLIIKNIINTLSLNEVMFIK